MLSDRAPRGRPHKEQREINSIKEKNLAVPYKKINIAKSLIISLRLMIKIVLSKRSLDFNNIKTEQDVSSDMSNNV